MHTPTQRKSSMDTHARGNRKTWVTPAFERRGSVAELVQVAKASGGDDSSGAKHEDGVTPPPSPGGF